MKLRKPTQNLLVDIAAFVAFAMMLGTGLTLRHMLPPGSGGPDGVHGGAREYLTVLGLSRHEWGSIHYWVSLALLGILALHLLLHWKWIVSMARGKPSEASGLRVATGVVGLAGVLILAAAPLLSPVERHARESERGLRVGRSAPDTLDATLAEPALWSGPGAEEPVAGRAPRSGRDSPAVQGRMTLAEVAGACGLELPELLTGLGLPADTPGDARIGRLQARGVTTLEEVRRICTH